MSFVRFPDLWTGYLPHMLPVGPGANGTSVIDATGEMVAWIGQVRTPDGLPRDVTRVQFYLGTVTKAGGSAWTLSLQNVSAAATPLQPDETQDQTVAIANADAGFVSNAYYRSGTFSAARTVNDGDFLAVVLEYDGAGRLGADTVAIRHFASGGTAGVGAMALKTGGTWAGTAQPNTLLLEFTDGSFGTLEPGWPHSVLSSIAFNSGSAADEIGLRFSVPFTTKLKGVSVDLLVAAGADYDLVLYEGTTQRAAISLDDHWTHSNAAARRYEVSFPETTIAANTEYFLALKPTTANNVTLYYFDVNTASHMQAHPGGTDWHYTTRVDAGAWTKATTRRPFVGLRFAGVEVGGGGNRFFGG